MPAQDIIITILTIIGSLGIFLYGMILMSEALQKVAGIRMRKVLSTITSNDFKGVLTGLSITGAIQSSSATTVMLVSFVNAGLISLRRSFALIMGANIGTTATAWIIVLLGFGKTFNINWVVLPIVAFSLPLLFSGRSIYRSWAEFIIGFAILFLGLGFLKTSIPILDESSAFVLQFENLVHYGYWSVLLFVGIGILLTIIFQSSSAVMALTFVIAVDGWIPYDMAVAMVLGENIGTTITANIAALVANRSAKRSAMFHLLFNVLGVIWALSAFQYFLQVIDVFMQWVAHTSPAHDRESIPLALAVFHTAFNILNTFIFIGLLPYLVKPLFRIIPDKKKRSREKFRLKHIGNSFVSTSELSIVQARKEIKLMSDIILKMFNMVPELMMERETRQYEKLYKKIRKYEKVTDRINIEIVNYLTKISESNLSLKGSEQVRNMLKVVDDMESIGDSCLNMATTIYRKNEEGIYFKQEIRDHLDEMFSLVRSALQMMARNVESDSAAMKEVLENEKKINDLHNSLRQSNIESLKEKRYNYKAGQVYTELIHQCERIGDHAINVSESLSR